jgi:hypothetical protein
MVHQNPPQLLRRHGIEVRAIPPLNRFGPADSKVRFMNYSRGLQRVLTVFASHFPAGNAMQLVIHKLDELVAGRLIARAPAVQKGCDRVRIARFLHMHYRQL